VLAIAGALGPEHPDNAIWLNNFAELYRATGASRSRGLHRAHW
jgi:hypothetical protein